MIGVFMEKHVSKHIYMLCICATCLSVKTYRHVMSICDKPRARTRRNGMNEMTRCDNRSKTEKRFKGP